MSTKQLVALLTHDVILGSLLIFFATNYQFQKLISKQQAKKCSTTKLISGHIHQQNVILGIGQTNVFFFYKHEVEAVKRFSVHM